MTESKWEKYKKRDKLDIVSLDEILVLLVGIITFAFFPIYQIIFIISVILWYWLKIRFCERKIIEKEREIYNIYYDNIKPIPQELIDKRTEKDREPMLYDLKQLENKRKFLVDKFIVLNLILVLLIELFIK
jgi:hypothetical protein